MTATSGNPTADKRFEFARQFAECGDHAAAADLIAQALELAPDWPEGQFSLGEALMLARQRDAAVAAFKDYLALDPADSMGAGAKLALLGVMNAHELSPAYVQRLFDQYAPRFDKALIEGLKYSAPTKIRAALNGRFNTCLDLGCGTGLMGAAVRDMVERLEGVDLSTGMLAEAKSKAMYDELRQQPLLDALSARPSAYDLILAADVLVYVGDLAAVMTAAARALAPGGVLAFTLQAGPGDFSLGADQRFSHSEAYIKQVVALAGLVLMRLDRDSFRRERNIDVPGLLVIARKP
jgi:predicted TPR repeat methyltransferase